VVDKPWEERRGGEMVKEDECGENIVYKYVNEKMILVEIIAGMGGEGDEEEWWRE
jgi:hypothetical protein